METKTRVFEVRQTVVREEDKQKIIFEKQEDGKWIYHAPNAQNHTQEQVEIILSKLKELNKGGD